MSVGPVSAPQPARQPSPAQEVGRSGAPAGRDARALADEFAAAARKGMVPLGKDAMSGGKAATGGKAPSTGPDGKPLRGTSDGTPLPSSMTARARALGDGARDAPSELRRDDSNTALTLLLPNGAPNAPAMQAPQAAAGHIDPGAFADLLTRIWTREQGRTAKEVRVSFGDAAWPATGARLLRLDDGSLRVTVSVGQRGTDLGDGLEALRERLSARGLQIADIAVEDDDRFGSS